MTDRPPFGAVLRRINPARISRLLSAMPPSRRRQWLAFNRDRLITTTFRKWRLRQCGVGTIVQSPLFWTPEFIELGARVLIWQGSRIEGIHEYLGTAYRPKIRLEDGVSLQQDCHIIAAGTLTIGYETTVSYGVMITDLDHQHEALGVNVLNQPITVRKTTIGSNCFIGAGARILAGTILGDHCVVGTNAVVRGSFPDACVIAGIPARIIKRFDVRCGQWLKTNAEGEFL